MAEHIGHIGALSPLWPGINRMAEREQGADTSGSAHPSASDEALAARVQATGDTAAYGILVTRYRARVIALARQMLASGRSASDEAEDVAQEAFVAAYEKRKTFRRGEPFRPWLYRIAVNRCLDRLRMQARRPATTEWANAPEPTTGVDTPLSLILAGERERRLEAAVAALPPKFRAVFLLRHLDALSYDEIATVMALPLGTVKTLLFRARAALRESLTGYFEP